MSHHDGGIPGVNDLLAVNHALLFSPIVSPFVMNRYPKLLNNAA